MDTIRLEPLDWRYSASIVGLYRYLKFYKLNYQLTQDYLEFDKKDIEKEKYLDFVEEYFKKSMTHIQIKNFIYSEDENSVKEVNRLIQGKSILKSLFSKIKYDGSNGKEIERILEENRLEIIENIYRNGKNLYSNFCNQGNLFNSIGKVCRVNGYYVDMGKKSKGNTYKYDNKSFVYTDSEFFDFIPLGFSRDRESFFVNSSISVEDLIRVNIVDYSEDTKNPFRTNFLLNCDKSVERIEYDVEVILKEREKGYFETLYIRSEAIEIFKSLKDSTKEVLQKPCKVEKRSSFSENEYLPIELIVTNSILNLNYLDNLIEFLLKMKGKTYLLSHLIEINRKIYKEEKHMSWNHTYAQEDAEKIKKRLVAKGNKLRAYEQKLVTAISLKDYDKVKEILIHLSSYTQLPIRALIPLCEDFEKNKNLAYVFINTLGYKEGSNEK